MTLDDARARDRVDPLAFARDRFSIPEGLTYLDGNSLGALPRATAERVDTLVLDQWGKDLIAGWNDHGWIDLPKRVAARLAPIVGANADELLVADSTSVCLFKLLSAAVAARQGRSEILTVEGNFPSDRYVVRGLADMLGLNLRTVALADLAEAIGKNTAAVTLTHVDYRSGVRADMAAINAAARTAGALAVWDLSHSAGAVALGLHRDGCELAVGCGYKYLNGGPGAPAFLYVASHLQDALHPQPQGWLGHADPFAFADHYRPADGIARFITGTPSVIALAALDAGLAAFEGIAMADVEAKAQALVRFFLDAVGDALPLHGPTDLGERGSHVCLVHDEAYAIMQALIARGVVGDFRQPNLMRFGFTPLYTRYEDCWRAADALRQVLDKREYDEPRFRDLKAVT
ncbi:kynureninase [Sphingomonas sabuli]|uniref:Kynureninase n=1 Tax=Sphingomonas sabuli TaxID=2764186 RepID=A0A7G9L537_9SPHN|nr:kynureninase [Sphingomonas sabuli]QNM83736.1 kynureninase [Sphingomonas sabuli]